MSDELSAVCSMEHLFDSTPFLLFRLAPFISFPIYLIAAIMIWRNRSKMVRAVRKQYFRQIFINFIFIVLLCLIVCPILIPPIPGYYMMGLLATFEMNVALPVVLMTHAVILVARAILLLVKHQLTTLSDLRFTRKFEVSVAVIRWLFRLCYLFMILTSLAILPSLTLEFELDGFRREAFEYFKNPLVLCPDMFIADPRKWKIYVPYIVSLTFAVCCSTTGVVSVCTCLLMIYESRRMVSRDTLVMQRNFTIMIIYQAFVYVVFIIIPAGIISALFYADVPLPEHGLYYLLMICAQGGVNNLMHIVPGFCKVSKKKEPRTQRVGNGKDRPMWSTTASFVIT